MCAPAPSGGYLPTHPPRAGTLPWAGTPPGQVHTPYPGRYTPQQVHPPGQVHTPYPGRYTPPSQAGTPPWQVHPPGRYTLWAGTPPSRYTPQAGKSRSRRLLLRTVRILLECILVRTVHHIKIHRTVVLAVQGKFEVNKNLITKTKLSYVQNERLHASLNKSFLFFLRIQSICNRTS